MKKIRLVALLLLGASLLASCQQLDIIGNDSVTAFAAILEALPENLAAKEAYGGWIIAAPDNAAAFFWSRDFSRTELYDIMLVCEAEPFLAAGLDLAKLPQDMLGTGELTGKIIVGAKLGQNAGEIANQTPLNAYERLVSLKPEVIGYHHSLGHFGASIGEGNVFEWAKDIGSNDKDIVYALNPEPFLQAGAEIEKIEGWVFGKVEAMDASGRVYVVDKLLKPFDIR